MSAKKLNLPLDKFADGAPITIGPEAELKTNYKDPVKRYELAERVVWSQTPTWKQKVIASCKLAGKKYIPYDKTAKTGITGGAKQDRILDEYAKAIVSLAESDAKLDKANALPPVPSFDLSSEIKLDKEGLTNK